MKRACLGCGALIELGARSRCAACERKRNRLKAATSPYHTAEWRRLSKQVKARDGTCRVCASTVRLAAHHRVPVSRGGANDPANVIALCQSHHTQYTNAVRDGKDTPLRRLLEGRP